MGHLFPRVTEIISSDFARTGAAVLLSCFLFSGCATSEFDAARAHFYAGELTLAEQSIDESDHSTLNDVLYLMERGTILQVAGRYEDSADNFIDAADKLQKLDTYSISKGAESLLVNDNVQPYVSIPFEKAMLHNLTALDHFAVGNWMNAGVEARRLVSLQSDEKRGDFPDDAFSRYIAGFAFQLTDDPSNAAIQYRKANELIATGSIIETTGCWSNSPGMKNDNMLHLFIMLGRSPTGSQLMNGSYIPSASPYADVLINGKKVGRSYLLTDIAKIAYENESELAVIRAAKSAARIAAKEGVAQALESGTGNDAVGDVARIILFGLLNDQDTRRWETLPRFIQLATVPCPDTLDSIQLVIHGGYQGTKTVNITRPITHRSKTFFSMYRDIP